MRIQGQAGFTLLELMVAITVLGILLAIGAPSFTRMIRDNRVAAQTNDLVTAIAVTRSEATKRGMRVSICAATAARNACAGDRTANWQNGWVVFADQTTAGTIDGANDIIRSFARSSPTVDVTTTDVGFIQFGPTGLRTDSTPIPTGGAAADEILFSVEHNPCANNQSRTVSVALSGRTSAVKSTC